MAAEENSTVPAQAEQRASVDAVAHPVIDAHQHFWDPRTNPLSAMIGKYEPLRRRFLPSDLEPLLVVAGVSRTIAVQADSLTEDTLDLLKLPARHPFVAAVVGWIDPEQLDPSSAISALLAAPGAAALVGIRLNARDNRDPDWLGGSRPSAAVKAISAAGLVSEFLMRPENLQVALRLFAEPGIGTCVVDHMMTFPSDPAARSAWKRAISELARLPNVYLKISGFIDDPAPAGWRPAAFQSAIDDVLEIWDADRLIFGTDWPVCTFARSYLEIVEWTRSALGSLTASQQAAILGMNAVRCYGFRIAETLDRERPRLF
jgi:L-fucono-1,5-lactonase